MSIFSLQIPPSNMRSLALIAGLLSLASTLLPTALADSKLTKFTSLTTGSKLKGIVKLDDALYTELTAAPRNYSAVVLLTALDQRYNCALCQEFQPEYELLAKSWIAKHKSGDGLFFGELDFANAKATFQKVCWLYSSLVMVDWGLTLNLFSCN